jgi:hypothetical protein
MGDFLKITGGLITDANANNSSAGAADAGKIPKLDAGGKFDTTMMPTGIAPETRSMTASEAISAGDLVNIWNSTGPKIRKADASAAGKEAHGFVLAAILSGASGTVYPEEAVISGLSGLTPGARQFLSPTTPGLRTETAPSTSGQVAQIIGTALSTTEVMFRPETPITIA